MTETTVIIGSSPTELAHNIAQKLDADIITSKIRTFPDGESKITLSAIPSGSCIVVQSTHPPVDTNLVFALSLVSQAAERSDDVTVVIPYMGYGRQDRQFLPGELVTIQRIAQLFLLTGVKNILTVDIHSMTALDYFGKSVRNVSAIPSLAKHFLEMNLEHPLVISPDQGGRTRAHQFAHILNTESLALEKRRDRNTGEIRIQNNSLSISNRNIILVDDMVSTGGSIVKAAEFLLSQGCADIYVACTHALLVNDALQKIRDAGVRNIISSNTIPGSTATVDVSAEVADALLGYVIHTTNPASQPELNI
ncbi:MAG: ribose-phosphate diphosphokinase [Cenarchaeum sp. SB0665_bin_23]|nr:ribose-phosphate diphosphokinase [Cenarchaeum sp. SB0667_bin_13]MXY60893.1 ribose-phosphate diphosphokinase [Cenarchaeum sp. SB0665_bin_23]MXZ93149.1 ribose-phosphate diphosphokinase [Cenarchaeum sp. SB0666_bin_15]MYB46936.1 ribose-phosphate diphosphokinase [Cenarchaeum sp. SB0662_bin_33]MYC80443.1 ribose-phosphate diphosphokinase [Cenarchaeum sp. SB0661_bin_35]MYD59126.1 ribose-phosphate diphosphokinase [Cenarchaeum sp. SB0678_bin_8]MYG32892.1 ribose-phosphate diphosphokinase [Cenarchaeum